MRRLTLEGLELVDAIDRKGSFSAAAEVLHKVPSTISYTVAKLEQDLGVSLFRRSGPRIEITEAGRELLREGRLLLQAASELEVRVKRVASGWESELKIAVDSVIDIETLAPAMADFAREAPGTTLRLAHEALTGAWEALLDLRADLVIAAGPGPAGGGYLARPVAEVGFWYCVAPQHPLAKARRPLTEAQRRAHRAVVVADSARRLPLRSTGLLTGQATVVVPHMRAKFRLQLEGLGVGYLPEPYARRAVEAGLLVHKPTEDPRPPETLHLAWRVGDEGKALAWWTERLGAPGAVQALIDNTARAYAAHRG